MIEGKLYRKLRQDRGLSLEQVADELNSVSFVSKFEKGNSNISMHRLERLLENINVTFEEFLYLRQLEKTPNLNEDINILRGYLTSDFYICLAEILSIVNEINKIGFKQGIKKMTEIMERLNPKISWQKFIIIYCEICILSYHSNLSEDEDQSIEKFMSQMNYLTKPVVSYLFKVEDWGVFEIILFKMFLFTFKVEQINQLLPIAISRTKKESELHVMKNYKMDIIYSSFAYFANFRHQEWAKKSLVMARSLLKNEKDLLNSTLLLFYEGWYGIIFEDHEKGLQSCHQAISIFKILEQPSLEKNVKKILESVLLNKKDPEGYLMFV